ncbi:hypothetical protein QFZ94_003369 [Paraburkholderia sp. JPY465]|uniref:hypothetical protein n=1 Tax=Paraburkholderia sp. JPY465 TaxID=3042285 RepID=UPI003D23F835
MNTKLNIGIDKDSSVGAPQAPEASARPLDIGELTIIMQAGSLPHCNYIGTRMQLEAEGILPADTRWPDGFAYGNKWEANGLCFSLCRQRPEGAKGPRRAFLDCDNWCLRIEPADGWSHDYVLEAKAKEMKALLYRRTPEWSKEQSERCKRYYAAEKDEKFQAFKALIPGLIPAPGKRRRPPKAAATQSQGV